MTKRILLVCLVIMGLVAAVLPAAAHDGDQVFTGVVVEGRVEAPHYELQTANGTFVLTGTQDFAKYVGQTVTIHGAASDEPSIFMRGLMLKVNSIVAGGQGGMGILPITDLGYSHWAANAILYVKNFGVFGSGIPSSEALDRPVTPAQFREWCRLVLNASSELETATIDNGTLTSSWQGYINRQNALVALLQLIGQKGAIVKDTGAELYSGAAAHFIDADRYLGFRDLGELSKLAAKAGLIGPTSSLRPTDALTMAEAATIIMRADMKYDLSKNAYSDTERVRTAALGDKRVGDWYDKHHGRLMVRYLDGQWEMLQTTADSPVTPVWLEIPEETALRIMKTPAAFGFTATDKATIECTFTQELGAGPHRMVVTLDAATLAVTGVTEYDK